MVVPSLTPPERRKLRLISAAVAVAGLALDVTTKSIAVASLDPERPVRLLGGLLTLQLVRNPGAAFSTGLGITPVFAVLAVVVLGILVGFIWRVGHPGWAAALGFLGAGVSGNLTDRLFRAPGPFRGHVVDYLQLPHWPIFNVADMCITTAVVLILVLSMIKNVGVDGRRYPRTVKAPKAAA